ncbi:MAG: hypothetical protein EA361_11155 [Bacteroidetes bacterium]|nr:MAG: hypothetical protein EA361_11155 [Bacteroidota bacterium]
MRKITLIAAMLLVNLHMVAAQTPPETAHEQKANELLKKASALVKGYSSMEIEFSYIMENTQMDITERMSGKIYSKGDKYRMVLGDNVFISDGKTVWNYIDDLYEIHINSIENTEGGLTPTALIEDFENEYRGKFIRQESHKGKLVDIIDLVPLAPQSFFKYRLALDARDHSIVYTIAYDRHGGTYTYNIDSLKPAKDIPNSMFVFNRSDYPENVDVIDLR